MNAPLKNVLKVQIGSLEGINFENFIDQLFLIKYGSDGYLPTRDTRDKGCDGIIIKDKMIIACYGPSKYNKNSFSQKIKDDYTKYEKYWFKEYPKWLFVVNHNLSPDQIIIVNNLNKESNILGLKSILSIIENDLNISQQRQISEYLNIDCNTFFANDYISEIITELLKNDNNNKVNYDIKNLVNVGDKININYSLEDVEDAKKEFEFAILEFPKIDSILSGYKDEQIQIMKSNAVSEFKMQNGLFKEKLNGLAEKYNERLSRGMDDNIRYYTNAFLLYLFEQCLIGDKV